MRKIAVFICLFFSCSSTVELPEELGSVAIGGVNNVPQGSFNVILGLPDSLQYEPTPNVSIGIGYPDSASFDSIFFDQISKVFTAKDKIK